MAHNPLSVELLRTLDAIERTGSFAKAAERLFKVPSALTYTIQKVEQDLGMELFDRSGHRASLTPAGRLITHKGRLILEAIDGLAQQARQVASGIEASLCLAIDTATLEPRHWPVLQAFREKFPMIELELKETVLSQTWELLLAKKAQIIISSQDLDPNLGGYDVVSLEPLRMLFCASPNHPAAQCSDPLSREQLSQYSNVAIEDPGQLLAKRSLGWLNPANRVLVSSMAAKIAAQKAGLGIGFLPEARIQDALEAGSLVHLQQHLPPRDSELVLAVHQQAQGPASQWLKQALIELYQKPSP